MSVVIVTPPATEPVSVAEAKLHLRVDHDAEDGTIALAIAAAREAVEQRLGLALITRRLRARLANISAPLQALPWGPVITVHAVRSGATFGVLSVVDPAHYEVAKAGERPALLWLLAGGPRGPCLDVEYDAGFGATPAATPPAVRQAILLLTAHFFVEREGAAPIPQSVDALLYAFAGAHL